MTTGRRYCGASTPYEDSEYGWAWCVIEADHPGRHEDKDGIPWGDGDIVMVSTAVLPVRAHQHEFVGDRDTCEEPGCTLTWGEYQAQQRILNQQELDSMRERVSPKEQE